MAGTFDKDYRESVVWHSAMLPAGIYQLIDGSGVRGKGHKECVESECSPTHKGDATLHFSLKTRQVRAMIECPLSCT